MDIEASYNFCRISETLTTSGVVGPAGLKALRAQGYDVVINLLPDTSEHAIPDERTTVESQGIEYIYIPVDFKQPTSSNFLQFSEAFDRVRDRKVHVHCAANWRVSAFYALHMVSRGQWDAEDAMTFIRGIWEPSEHPAWSNFIAGALAEARTQPRDPHEPSGRTTSTGQ
jgi:protein tyrosine phosphatase (PTP) superfamily phosphohydrolase (DUF442 family)